MEAIITTLISSISAVIVCIINIQQKKMLLKLEKRESDRGEKDRAREGLELLIIKSSNAAIALGEATAKAVQRMPDAHCNGDMHKALDYARQIKHEQKDFLSEQGIKHIID